MTLTRIFKNLSRQKIVDGKEISLLCSAHSRQAVDGHVFWRQAGNPSSLNAVDKLCDLTSHPIPSPESTVDMTCALASVLCLQAPEASGLKALVRFATRLTTSWLDRAGAFFALVFSPIVHCSLRKGEDADDQPVDPQTAAPKDLPRKGPPHAGLARRSAASAPASTRRPRRSRTRLCVRSPRFA